MTSRRITWERLNLKKTCVRNLCWNERDKEKKRQKRLSGRFLNRDLRAWKKNKGMCLRKKRKQTLFSSLGPDTRVLDRVEEIFEESSTNDTSIEEYFNVFLNQVADVIGKSKKHAVVSSKTKSNAGKTNKTVLGRVGIAVEVTFMKFL